eukprot:scaffold19831_cov40-Attheya_sp.AAC.2
MRLYPSRTIAGLDGASPPSVAKATPARSCSKMSSMGVGGFHAAPIRVVFISRSSCEILPYVS